MYLLLTLENNGQTHADHTRWTRVDLRAKCSKLAEKIGGKYNMDMGTMCCLSSPVPRRVNRQRHDTPGKEYATSVKWMGAILIPAFGLFHLVSPVVHSRIDRGSAAAYPSSSN